MNKKLKVFLALIFFFYFTIYLFSLTFSAKPQPSSHERLIVMLVSPLQRSVVVIYENVSSVISRYLFLVRTAKKNEQLVLENADLRRQLIELHETRSENVRLRDLLDLPVPKEMRTIHAERVAFGSNEFERSIRVNKGLAAGVAVGMPVLSTHGVVGQVAEVYPNYSNILLLTDKASAIDVTVQRTRARGILKGFTRHQLAFEFVSVDEDIQVGDVIVSSGLDGVYPEGIPVGVVEAFTKQGRRLFLTATVDPYVNFSKIEEVRILVYQP